MLCWGELLKKDFETLLWGLRKERHSILKGINGKDLKEIYFFVCYPIEIILKKDPTYN